MKTRIYQLVSITALFLTVTAFSFAWTGPTALPPEGNISAPVNTGSLVQTKTGSFGVGGNMIIEGLLGGAPLTNGLIVSNGKVGIGTASPSEKLQVDGNIKANDFCTDTGLCLTNVASADTTTKGCFVSYSGSCPAGFTNEATAGTWGSCRENLSTTVLSYFSPPGGGCSGIASRSPYYTAVGTAYVCCK